MKPGKEDKKIDKVEESAVEYEVKKTKIKGIDRDTFDFDTEFAKGLTPEEFKEEMSKRIKVYPWKNNF